MGVTAAEIFPVVRNSPGASFVKIKMRTWGAETGGTIVANCSVPEINETPVVGLTDAADARVGGR
jgi:hypothetical protein